MAVEDKTWSLDGVAGIYLKALDDNGAETGNFLRMLGAKSLSAKKVNTTRTVLADNAIYEENTKFQKFDLTVNLAGIRPGRLVYCVPGSLAVVGNKATYDETASGLPGKFNLYVKSDASDPAGGGSLAAADTVYYNCQAQNFDTDKTSGDLSEIVMTITSTKNTAGLVRTWIFDEDLIGVDTVATDTTAPTVAAHVPTAAATGVVVSANLTVNFSEQMNALSVEDYRNYQITKLSDNTVIDLSGATFTYVVDTPFQVTINPNGSLGAATEYALTVKAGVRDVAGNNMAADYITTFTTA